MGLYVYVRALSFYCSQILSPWLGRYNRTKNLASVLFRKGNALKLSTLWKANFKKCILHILLTHIVSYTVTHFLEYTLK
jgi:hypothetical protein